MSEIRGATQTVTESDAEATVMAITSAPVDMVGGVGAGTETEIETETASKTDVGSDDYLIHSRNQDISTGLLIRMGELYGIIRPEWWGFWSIARSVRSLSEVLSQ